MGLWAKHSISLSLPVFICMVDWIIFVQWCTHSECSLTYCWYMSLKCTCGQALRKPTLKPKDEFSINWYLGHISHYACIEMYSVLRVWSRWWQRERMSHGFWLSVQRTPALCRSSYSPGTRLHWLLCSLFRPMGLLFGSQRESYGSGDRAVGNSQAPPGAHSTVSLSQQRSQLWWPLWEQHGDSAALHGNNMSPPMPTHLSSGFLPLSSTSLGKVLGINHLYQGMGKHQWLALPF
jgi:hypothetical protein